MRQWSFYDPVSGEFSGISYTGPLSGLAANTPKGMAAYEGIVNWRKNRLDIETQSLVDYDRPKSLKEIEIDKRISRSRIDSKLAKLDNRQVRTIVDMLLDPLNVEAMNRLQTSEAEKKALRDERRKFTETETSERR